jgi:hypothetical protein
MSKKRDTYKYVFKVGRKIVHGGITNDLDRREQEYKQQWPKGNIVQVGRRTTEAAAKKWEKDHNRGSIDKAPPIAGSRQEKEYRRAVREVLTQEITSTKTWSTKKSTSKGH